MDGFINVFKPLGKTSSDVVVYIRRRLPRGVKVGHGGTLDPEATGVLPICVGGAARLFDYIVDKQKTYIATLKLGATTTTQDATGETVSVRAVECDMNDVENAAKRFIGEIDQIPPMYSAIKKDGRRLYQLARKGETIEVEPRKCVVHDISVIERVDMSTYKIRVECGKGVYIRTLCNDIGEYLGCGGHMAALERVSSGVFSIDSALTLDDIDKLYETGSLEDAVLPMDFPIKHIPFVRVDNSRIHAIINGNQLKREWLDKPAPKGDLRIYMNDVFCGMGCADPRGDVRFKAKLVSNGDLV